MIHSFRAHLTSARQRFFQVENSGFEPPVHHDSRPMVLSLLVVLFYVVYQLLMQPGWVLGGEMWAEMATNYFPNANSASYWDKFFATDAGYIPAPQRLIAFIGNQLHLSAASIPYFYTWSAILLTGGMVAVFCLQRFRILIRSDSLRFLTAISILMVADFETRTFINFTYFAAFFLAILTALALVDDTQELPWWAWFCPVLLVSKPAVLAALPAMVLVAFVSRARFRWMTIVAVLLCMAQIVQMVISAKSGVMPYRANDIALLAKIIAAISYFLGFLGGYFSGHVFTVDSNHLVLIGLILLGACGRIIYKKSSKANALVVIGLSLLLFNTLLNAFALSDSWNLSLDRLDGVPVYRHIIVGFNGCILVLAGMFSQCSGKASVQTTSDFAKIRGTVLFFIWFAGTGWISFAGNISREPGPSIVNNSQWQRMAGAIDAGISPLCVPVDPWWKGASWMYQRHCGLLKSAPAWDDGAVFINAPLSVDISPPSSLAEKTLLSAAILLRPYSTNKSFVEARMVMKLVDGGFQTYYGARELGASGGLLLLAGKEGIPIKNISSIRLTFNLPVEVALRANDPGRIPGVAWMGN